MIMSIGFILDLLLLEEAFFATEKNTQQKIALHMLVTTCINYCHRYVVGGLFLVHPCIQVDVRLAIFRVDANTKIKGADVIRDPHLPCDTTASTYFWYVVATTYWYR